MNKKILILGAGLVARPMIEYLLKYDNYEVTVASRTVSRANALTAGHPRSRAESVDAVKEPGRLRQLIEWADLTVSLLPAAHHIIAAEICLDAGKHLVTTSYESPAMAALSKTAEGKKLTFLNECGLDPGIDHMTAVKLFDEIRIRGGRIVQFKSDCGGLPAPDSNNNPFGYKFSWSPLGVLMAMRNSAHFLRDGKDIIVPADKLFSDPEPLEIRGLGSFEVYPNRDSLSYIEKYNLQGISTMKRGTIRNQGHCETWRYIIELGLLDIEKIYNLEGASRREFIKTALGCGNLEPESFISSKLKVDINHQVIKKLEWLGFFSETPLCMSQGRAIDVLCSVLSSKLAYEPGERDMVILRHNIIAEFGGKQERFLSTLVDFGIPGGDSSMARTVSLPAAIASRLILEGIITRRGVMIPVFKDIYEPLLEELLTLGVKFEEHTEALAG